MDLESVSTGRGLRIAKKNADLHANLINEDDERVGLRDRGRELAQGLRGTLTAVIKHIHTLQS